MSDLGTAGNIIHNNPTNPPRDGGAPPEPARPDVADSNSEALDYSENERNAGRRIPPNTNVAR